MHMKTRLMGLAALLSLLAACSGTRSGGGKEIPEGISFTAIDTHFLCRTLELPAGFNAQVIFSQGDPVKQPGTGRLVPAKGKHDFMAYLPINGSSEEGWLWVNHEATAPDSLLGDGGGATLLHLKKENGAWKTFGDPEAVDFSNVGGTWHNCLGSATPWGTVLTGEEYEVESNAKLASLKWKDTSDYNGFKRHLNYGWVVEVDPVSKKAVRKLWQLGRFSHEGIYVMPDQKTVYLLDDYAPGLIFKFVATRAGDLTAGQLYFYRQTDAAGEWVAMPMDMHSLQFARETALSMGATFFLRVEDLELANDGTMYITETGSDPVDLSQALAKGGKPARHLAALQSGNGLFEDVHGRLLKMDMKTLAISVALEGGPGSGPGFIQLNNPDNLAYDHARNVLCIHEDILDGSKGRVPPHAEGNLCNEVYFLTLTGGTYQSGDLVRFANVPVGAETTGGCFTPDHKTLFLNVQSPSKENPAPYNKSCTVAITGF